MSPWGLENPIAVISSVERVQLKAWKMQIKAVSGRTPEEINTSLKV